jgi:FRG domain
MRYPDQEVTSVSDLVEVLKAHLQGINAPVWYRGQSKAEWQLVPKLLREATAPSELFLINRFKQNATLLLLQHPKSDFEWLFLM